MEKEIKILYEIRIQGRLDSDWSGWFEDLDIHNEDENITCLSGYIIDEAALHGILKKIRDLGLPLRSISSKESDE